MTANEQGDLTAGGRGAWALSGTLYASPLSPKHAGNAELSTWCRKPAVFINQFLFLHRRCREVINLYKTGRSSRTL